MKPDRFISLSCLIAIESFALFFSCASLGGGDVTETGNARISGRVVDSQGYGVQNVRVQLLPDLYDPVRDGTPPNSSVAITDESGSYTIRTPADGIYNIEAMYPATGDRALVRGIGVYGRETSIAPYAAIQRPGAIKVLLPSQSSATVAYLYLPGTTRFGRVTGSAVYIDSVPAGSYATVNYVDQADTTRNRSIKTNFTVTSGATVFITDSQAWGFSRKLFLNTTSSGAAVSGNVYSFPVLVRLSAGNFDFSEARSGGEDVRFVKADGSPLPFEIERWDPVARQAEIWVKVDTVYGNDDTRQVTMLWGDASATDRSNSAAVFDTANGFQGVWHLAGAGNAEARDATGHHHDGTPTDTAPQTVPGAIGDALQFDGNANGLVMKNTGNSALNFSRPGTYTFSAWVYVDTVYDADEFIAGKGYDQYALRVKGSQSIPANMFALHEYIDAPVYGTDIRYAPVVTKQWKFVVGIRDTFRSYLFIDGTCVDSTGMMNLYPQDNPLDSTNFSIGRCAAAYAAPANTNEYLAFKGKIDEVRIASVRFSADRVKLSYMNQKQQDALIKW